MPSVLITGAGRGLGRALLEVYSERGWTTFPLLRSFEVAAELETASPESCHPIVADVRADDLETRITAALGQHPAGLDVLVNNAGNIRKLRGLAQTTPEDLLDLFRVHCVGALGCTRAALPFLTRTGRGIVVNVTSRKGSIRGVLEGRGTGIYSYQIAKAAQNMLSACLDFELRETGVRVFAVHPGRLTTEVGPADADTPPRVAAVRLADWVASVDSRTACGLHDVMDDRLLDW
jgi:NAD(P)-dependent dehydrogenase (short-subunit alcohol dehydrogenase family)